MADKDRVEQVTLLAKHDRASSTREEDELFEEMDRLNADAAADGSRHGGRRGHRRRRSSLWQRAKRICQTRRKSCIVCVGIFIVVLIALTSGGTYVYTKAPVDGQSPPWYPTPPGGALSKWRDSYERAARLVDQMSLIEKVNITTGTGWMMGPCVGNTGPALNVGFPSLCLQDGPLGIRFADNISAFPAGITVGATWNRKLMYARGRAHGNEARRKGVHVLLGPAMGPLGKMPAGGRNWEGFGADPYLQGVAAAETIRGIQDEGVIATAKHYIGNEQEHYRQSFEWGIPNALSANIDDRTLHELYLWPFAESVRAGVGSIMCSYQMVNNSYACGNSKLLNGILKDELGFQGFVQSDWLAQRGGVSSALAGLDMTMPGDGLHWANGDSLWGPRLTTAILNGSLPLSRLNDMVARIVATYYQVQIDNTTLFPRPSMPNFSSWTDEREGLLYPGSGEGPSGVTNEFVDVRGGENEGDSAHKEVARIVAAEAITLVKNKDSILPLKRDGGVARGETFRVGVFGEDAGAGRGPNACKDRGCNQGTLASGWGSGAVEFPYLVTPLDALKREFASSVQLTSHLSNTPPSSSELSSLSLCLVFINADSGEGYLNVDGVRGDRNDLFAQKGGDELVVSVAKGCGGGNGKTVVVIHSVGPVVVERWIDLPGVKAVLFAHLPGQESGDALADVLFGDVNPSGRLPYTVGMTLEDYGEGGQILYYPNGAIPQQDFDEGLYIDYRHFDKFNVTPRYEFGYGISYGSFEIYDLKVKTNKGKQAFPPPITDLLDPVRMDETVPSAKDAVLPSGFRRLKNYIYPYINSADDVKRGSYPYPDGYDSKQPKSLAGGGEGGNPHLWDVHADVEVTVANTGDIPGQQVIQLYVSFPENVPLKVDQFGGPESDATKGPFVDFPVRVLRGFEKVRVLPGRSETVKFRLTRKDLSYWNVEHQNWAMPVQGHFKFWVGTSSRDLPLSAVW